jgi:predicted HicB family RNase H-like nuclease
LFLEQSKKAIIFAFQFIQKENQIMRKAKFKKQLTIAILPEHFEQIQKITDDQEISLAEWIRNAVSAALTKNQPKENQMND